MDCREFRSKHVAFVDDLLSAMEMDAMHRHLRACHRCSRQDSAVRRSLMLIRNLPTIEPSPDFMARLNSRLQEVGPGRPDQIAPRPYFASAGTLTALAASLVAIGYFAIETQNYFAPPVELQLTPAVAGLAAEQPTPVANLAFVASVPTGMPVWPAVLMAGQTPMQFASNAFRERK